MFSPKYTISNQTINQLSEIAEIKAIVSRSRLLPQRESFLRKVATIKMAHTSTSIEGNTLQEFEVAKLIEKKPVNASEDQITEVKNYLKALKMVDTLSKTTKKISTKTVSDIHKIVVDKLVEDKKVGTFRNSPVYIVNVDHNGREEIVYTPPKYEKVPSLIEDLISWIEKNQNVHPIIRAALFHYQFETIHPFVDGNGRTGRLLTLLHLYQSGWDFKKILVLEDYYNQYRQNYYEALQTEVNYEKRKNVDLSHWIEYYVEGFLFEAKKVKDLIQNLPKTKDTKQEPVNLDRDEIEIVDFVVSLGKITSSDVVDILNIPKRTAQAKLKKLEDIKILKKSGGGPNTYYIISKD